jgi:hypothetical protein
MAFALTLIDDKLVVKTTKQPKICSCLPGKMYIKSGSSGLSRIESMIQLRIVARVKRLESRWRLAIFVHVYSEIEIPGSTKSLGSRVSLDIDAEW